MGWQPIETARTERASGALIEGRRTAGGRVVWGGFMRWGIFYDPSAPQRGPGEPAWLTGDGAHKVPRPTEWRRDMS